MAEKDLSFVEHLAELRKRILVSILAVLAGAVAGWLCIDPIVRKLLLPAGGRSFVFLAPQDLFLTYLRIAFAAGLTLASPVILFETAAFLLPALRGREKRLLLFLVPLGGAFFLGGVLFAYYAILPLTLRFFLSYAVPAISPMLSFSEYIDFCLSLLFSFGAAFELPLIVLLLTRTGIIRSRTLARARKYALLGILILAAVLTPPDVVSQILLAAPLYLLFELSVLLSRLFPD